MEELKQLIEQYEHDRKVLARLIPASADLARKTFELQYRWLGEIVASLRPILANAKV